MLCGSIAVQGDRLLARLSTIHWVIATLGLFKAAPPLHLQDAHRLPLHPAVALILSGSRAGFHVDTIAMS